MPKITELIESVNAAETLSEVRRNVAELTRDRRRRVTPALRKAVLRWAGKGLKAAAIQGKLPLKISPPTIRKIIRDGKQGC